MGKLFLIYFGLNLANGKALDTNRKWTACSTSLNCILVRAQCGIPASINKSYANTFEVQVHKNEACAASVDFDKAKMRKTVECIEGTCRLCNSWGSKGRCGPGS